MKKLIFILMVGSLFALDQLILVNGESIKGQYVKTENNKIYFIPEGTLVTQSINEDLVRNINENLARNIIQKEYYSSTNKLVTSGKNLIEFRKQYYNGFIMGLVGQLAIGYGIMASENGVVVAGYLIAFIGSIQQLASFNYAGEAGEDLIDAGEKLETEQNSD